MPDDSRNPIYMNVVALINGGAYDQLWECYKRKDTRASYLITFMRKVSVAMHRNINDHPLYLKMIERRQGSDLTDPEERLRESEFHAWLKMIEEILRSEDMLIMYRKSKDYSAGEVNILDIDGTRCRADVLADLLKMLFEPGKTHIIDGNKGGGKTHLAVYLMWLLCCRMVGKITSDKRVIKYHAITNINFGKRVDGKIIKDMPENVFYANTFSDIFFRISEILSSENDAGHEIRIVLILDESQNFINTYRANTTISVELQQFFANTRKLGISVIMLTPMKKYLPPSVRTFTNQQDSEEIGYNNYLWEKRPTRASAYIRQNDLNLSPKCFVFLQNGDRIDSGSNDNESMLFVPSCPWTRAHEELKEGEVSYDHTSIAMLTAGDENFSLAEFMGRISGLLSGDVAEMVKRYMDNVRDHGAAAGSIDEKKESVMMTKRNIYVEICKIIKNNIPELAKDWSKHLDLIRKDERFATYPQVGDISLSGDLNHVYSTYKIYDGSAACTNSQNDRASEAVQ